MKLTIRNSGYYLNRLVMFTAMSMVLVSGSLLLAQPAVADKSSNTPTEQADIPAEDNQSLEGSAETLNQWLDDKLSSINAVLAQVLFWDVTFGQLKSPVPDAQGQPVLQGPEIPFVIAFLVFGAVFFTFWHGLINIRAFKHAIDVVRGKFDRPEDVGEITHFRALTSALSATVGLGNIAGVAIAVRMGGPGAVFWMMILAVFGMTAKFHECTLAQMFRRRNADGSISGGPMFYLHEGLRQVNPLLGGLGKFLAILFAIMCIGGALGGGNMFQANQSFEAFASAFQVPGESRALISQGFGIIMAGLVAAVIIGGIKRIGAATSRIVPSMCGLYVLASVVIIAVNFREIPHVIALIFNSAFNPDAALGGVIAVMIIGFQRAAFSNEAGLGSAAIAHAAAKTEEPVREGIVSLLGPFIDTIVICAMTAMVVIITGAYKDAPSDVSGSAVTMYAFQELPGIGVWFPYILSICIILFAFSTMISWCYYGERAWDSLFGNRSVIIFRILFVVAVFIGAVIPLKAVLNFSDLMILCMAFPNILGGLILAPMVKEKAKDYWTRYKSGQMEPTSTS